MSDADLAGPLAFYARGRARGGFEDGIELALRALLTSTEFLFRIEQDPPGCPRARRTAERRRAWPRVCRSSCGAACRTTSCSASPSAARWATRLCSRAQVTRMLADPRARSLATNFAGQWLYLRNLDAARPNLRLYPDFDDNLRRAMRRETELLFASIVEENRDVLDLLRADYTFLNERLARHYDVPNVYGDHFRRVALGPDGRRAGLLGHGSILTVTSYATRTSPVLRGKWVLDNLLGMPPPPRAPDVPPLDEGAAGGEAPSMRERMAQHRRNPACAACHQLMDPAGLAMENFDAVGRWRERDEAWRAIDAAGSLPGSAEFDGVAGLRQALLARPDLFVRDAGGEAADVRAGARR